MHNLLRVPLPETEIARILATTAGRPALPPLGAPAWDAARRTPAVRAWLPELRRRALAEADAPLPPLTDALYADFYRTGERLPFETPYFERRRQLARAAIAILLGDEDDRERLAPSLLAKLDDVLAEESWSLPAHVWTRPDGKDPMTIDLFAAECANTFAELLVVFGSILPPTAAARIRARLRTQFFANYVDRVPPFHWTAITNNWNAVCHQGVLGAALAVEDDHDLVARMLARAARALPCFLSGFGDDGSTSEGPGYWSYGFGWFSELNAQLEHRTAGALSLFEGDDKMLRISRFAPLMTLSGGHLVNFSDGDRTGRLNPALLAYLGRRLDDPLLRTMGTAGYRHQADHSLDLDEPRRDLFNLTRLALHSPEEAELASARDPALPDAYFPDYGAMVARGADKRGHLWEFAAKGGHNAEHHNHNDCGSWLLNIDGSPAVIEIGAPEYTRAFFSEEQRYTFLAARSLGHSVPLVNGHEQPPGRNAAATVLSAKLAPAKAVFSVDLAKAYPAAAGCVRLARSWTFDKTDGSIELSDTYSLADPGPVESMIILPILPVLEDGAATIALPSGRLRITPGPDTIIAAVEPCDYREHRGANGRVFRLRLIQAGPPASTGTLSCRLTLA